MKFKEYLIEAEDKGLIGASVNMAPYLTPIKHSAGAFYCSHNNLTSLKGAPEDVIGNFECMHSNLPTLKGAPNYVEGNFDCSHNNLTTLEGAPKVVMAYFNCANNKLITLKGVGNCHGPFNCGSNNLTTLEYAPPVVGGMFYCEGNSLFSLEGIHKIFKEIKGPFYAAHNPIKSHVLGLLLIPGITHIDIGHKRVEDILDKYLHLGKGRASLIDCQNDLIEAGLEEYAQL